MHSQIEVGTTRAVKYVPTEIAVAIERLCCESRGIEPAKNALLETGGGVANDIRAITPAGVGPGSRFLMSNGRPVVKTVRTSMPQSLASMAPKPFAPLANGSE